MDPHAIVTISSLSLPSLKVDPGAQKVPTFIVGAIVTISSCDPYWIECFRIEESKIVEVIRGKKGGEESIRVISTAQLRPSLTLHLQPINVIVSNVP